MKKYSKYIKKNKNIYILIHKNTYTTIIAANTRYTNFDTRVKLSCIGIGVFQYTKIHKDRIILIFRYAKIYNEDVLITSIRNK